MTLLILYIALALGVSFLCSVLEAVLLSVTPSFLALMHRRNATIAARLERYKTDIDRPLAAILSLNTVAHTVGATGAGAQAAKVFGDMWVGVFSGVLTLAILFASEIIPKTLGAVYWKNLAPVVTRTLPVIIAIAWPLMKLSMLLTRLIARRRGGRGTSRAELAALAEAAAREGAVAEEEWRILQNLFRLRRLPVEAVMTPRTMIHSLPTDSKVGDVMGESQTMRFSRVPVYRDEPDNMVGYVLKSDLLMAASRDRFDTPLEELMRDLMAIPETAGVTGALQQLVEGGHHIALVVDEYGDIVGLVTIEDIVETLLGLDIVDEYDTITNLREFARKRWRRRAARLGIVEEDEGDAGDD